MDAQFAGPGAGFVAGPLFVGIDVLKGWLDVHVVPSGEAWRVDNDEAGLARLRERLVLLGVERVALEATGGLERLCVALLGAAGLLVVWDCPGFMEGYGA